MKRNHLLLCRASIFVVFAAITNFSFSQSNTLPSNGNVGIGTTTPSTKLQVNGSARIDSTLIVKDSLVIHRSARVKSDLKVDGNAVLRNDATVRNDFKVLGKSTLIGDVIVREGDLKIRSIADTAATESGVLLIKPNGKVENGGSLKSLVYAETAQQIPCKTDFNGGIIYSAPYWQASASPQRMFLINTPCSPDPRLGVGVKPDAKLHVQLNTGSNLHPLLIEKRLSNNPNAPEPTRKLLQLDHTGLLFAREIKVNLDQWPDYVFDEQYALMPLDELKDFIKKNNHLPNVPSACEMEEKGLNVSESNVMLMEKVEELTLYMLQINDQVKTQQELLTQQQETIRLQQELIQQLKEQITVKP